MRDLWKTFKDFARGFIRRIPWAETLVVIAIIAVIIAMLLPAISMARKAARDQQKLIESAPLYADGMIEDGDKPIPYDCLSLDRGKTWYSIRRSDDRVELSPADPKLNSLLRFKFQETKK